MKWSDQYSTGIEYLDQQHKLLFKMSEDYRATLNEGRGERVYGMLLQSLDQYARAHFDFEEQCMHRYQCPVAKTNSQAHAKFVEALSEFRERYTVSGFRFTDAQELVEFVDEWLANHIGRIDAQLKPYIEKT